MWRLALMLAVCSPGSALAQTYSPLQYREWEVTFFTGGSSIGGYHFPTRVFGSAVETSRTIGVEYRPGNQLGLRLTENVNDSWAADLEYSFALHNLRFSNLSPDVPDLSAKTYVHHIDYNVVYLALPRDKRFRPYAQVGVGGVLFFIDGKSSGEAQQRGLQLHDSWRFLFNVGGGLKYLIMDQFAVAFDLKDGVSRLPSYGLPDSVLVVNGEYHPGVSVHGTVNNWQFSIGANVQWDDFAFRHRSRKNSTEPPGLGSVLR